MKAILLAAGLGSRLGDMTQELPKCMIEVGGTPLLWRNLTWAAANGVSEAAVNLHHRAEVVLAYFQSHQPPLPVHWSHEPRLLGTAGTVRSLERWIGEERFAVIYADNVIGCDFCSLVALHERLDAAATVALFERKDVSQSGVAELDAEDRIIRFIEKPAPGASESHWVNAGLLLLEAEIVHTSPKRGDIGRDLLPALVAEGRVVAGYRMGPRETLHWVDTPTDLERTQSAFTGAPA